VATGGNVSGDAAGLESEDRRRSDVIGERTPLARVSGHLHERGRRPARRRRGLREAAPPGHYGTRRARQPGPPGRPASRAPPLCSRGA